jgi:hypothetical protein
MDALIVAVEGLLAQGVFLATRELIGIAHHLGACDAFNDDVVAQREQRLRALIKHFPEPDIRLDLECGFTASMAARDPDGAVDQLRAQIGEIGLFAELPSGAPYLARMWAEVTGRLVGPRRRQADATSDVGAAIIAVSSHRPEAAKQLLGELLGAVQMIDSPNDLAQALRDFFHNGRNATAAFLKTAAPVFSRAVDAAAELSSDSLKTHALDEGIEMYNAVGDFTSAQAVVERLPDEDTRTRAGTSLNMAKEKAEVGELSAFERAFVDVHPSNWNWAVLHFIKCFGAEKTIVDLSKALASGEIQQNSSDILCWVRAMFAPALAFEGTAALASIVDSVRDFDQRLLDAGRLIGQAQAGPAN